MSELPAPLTPADCDIKDCPFMPMEIHLLFDSEFHALSDEAAWRACITLWLKSFHQVAYLDKDLGKAVEAQQDIAEKIGF